MKRLLERLIICVSLLLCSLSQASAQDSYALAEQILSRLEDNRVSLNYSCTIDTGSVPFEISGKLVAQGNCYRAEGNGLVIICNGPVRWTIDPEAREAYIEDADGIREVLLYRDNLVKLELKDVQYLPLSETDGEFSFDCSALDPDWVVTDLREVTDLPGE